MKFLLFLVITSFSFLKAHDVAAVLQAVPCAQEYAYTITPYEWQELELDAYIKQFDRTHTWAGNWGLQQLTRPIADYQALIKRQQGLKYLDQHPERVYQWYKLLDMLASDQQHLFVYYDQHDQLANKVKQLYFSWFSSLLNKSQLALDYAYVSDLVSSAITLIGLLSVNSMCAEFISAQLQGRSIHLVQGALGGFSHLINAHRLDDHGYQQLKQQGGFDNKTVAVNPQAESFTRFGGLVNAITGALQSAIAMLAKPASTQTIFKGTFGDKWSFYHEQCHIPSCIAACLVAGNVLYLDQCLLIRVNQHYRKLRSLFYTYRSLQHRLVGVARFMQNARELLQAAQTVDALAENAIVKEAYVLCTSPTSDLAQVITHLQSSNYAQERNVGYSPGHALITHTLINERKQQLVHVLQAVGIIDAYVSIYRVYDEHKNKNNSFCFADLVCSGDPFCMFDNAWLPLVSQQQDQHSCIIGLNQPRNMLLTGPNGSGKSYFLKLVGGLVVLAQSWTIVPATTCSLSLLQALRTSFNPQEDIMRGVSTFMAQKERLDVLHSLVTQHMHEGCCMVLIDEPYRGTIEAEAEQRCYQWCTSVAEYAHGMQLVACHLKKPLELVKRNDFAIKQFEVLMHDDGSFTRTFKLKDGAPSWWFDDMAKRMAFVDSL